MLKRLFLVASILFSILLLGALAWLGSPHDIEKPAVEKALDSDRQVSVEQGTFQVFSPVATTASTGVIFYPGGKSAVGTYAPVLKQLAGCGLLVVNVPMPLHVAFLGIDKADQVMASFPDIDRWYLAGHSMGGVAAVEYAADKPHGLDGLILWASYPASDISHLGIPVLSVYGRQDQMTTVHEVEQFMPLLPQHTRYVAVEANHWSFGHFDRSPVPGEQRIDRLRAQRAIVAATGGFAGSDQPCPRGSSRP